MNFNMKIRTIALTSAILFSAGSALAAEQDSIVSQQKSLLEKLDSLNDAVLGLRVNGTARAGGLTSIGSSDNFSDDSPTQENLAYTDVDLRFLANPSSETHVDVRMRLHKDWQSAYDVNNNPVIGHWFSYDGTILNKHLDFNLGYMRVGYSPLTIYTPSTEFLQEPEIFSARRVDALDRRNLDTTDRRVMQGLNLAYTSGALGPVDDVTMQLTGARLRNGAKKDDQVFFDFDYTDRYLLGARLGVDLYGVHVGGNLVNVSDRKLTARTRSIAASDTLIYDYNRVISAELGFDSKKMLSSLPVAFGLNGEFAMSTWETDMDYMSKQSYKIYQQGENFGYKDGERIDGVYITVVEKSKDVRVNESVSSEDGKSFYVEPYVKGDIADVDFTVKVNYIQTDEKFWSEMAAAPNFANDAVVLNSNALYTSQLDSFVMATFGASSLENLYFNAYETENLEASNLMTSYSTNVLSDNKENTQYLYGRLNNNYKVGHFFRNGYTASALKLSETEAVSRLVLDPTVSLAAPFGAATPNRKGISAGVDVNWNDGVTFNARFSKLSLVNTEGGDNNYMQYAAGLGVDIGRIIDLGRMLKIQGSYDHGEEDAGFGRQNDRIIAGATLEVWGPIAILAGYQNYKRTFGDGCFMNNVYIKEVSEMLALGGLRFKIAPASYLSLQGGMLSSELNYAVPDATGALVPGDLAIDKIIATAEVTVNF